jgi:hypothetical protein
MYKYPGGVEAHKKVFEYEGFTVTACGKNCPVPDFDQFLA